MHLYLRTIPALQITSKMLHQFSLGAKVPNQDIPLAPACKQLIERTIANSNWSVAQSMNNALINHFLALLKFKNQATANARMKQFYGMEDQCSDYLLKLRNVRTLYGEDLAKLVQLISYLPYRKEGEFD